MLICQPSSISLLFKGFHWIGQIKMAAHLPNVRMMVTWATSQELVVGANSGLHVKRGVEVTTEDCHCNRKTCMNIRNNMHSTRHWNHQNNISVVQSTQGEYTKCGQHNSKQIWSWGAGLNSEQFLCPNWKKVGAHKEIRAQWNVFAILKLESLHFSRCNGAPK